METEVINDNVVNSNDMVEGNGSTQLPAHDESDTLKQPPVPETLAAPVSSADAEPVSSETSALQDPEFKTPSQVPNKSEGRGRAAAPGRSASKSKSRSRSRAKRPDNTTDHSERTPEMGQTGDRNLLEPSVGQLI